MKLLTVIVLFLFILSGCSKISDSRIRERGVIKQQGATTYQYGSHTFTNDDHFYSLTSDKVNLDEYINQEVLWMCIRSYRLHQCFYINYFSIMSYTYEAEFVMIHFYDDHVMKLAQVGEFKTQMKRCLKLLEFIKNRKCLHR